MGLFSDDNCFCAAINNYHPKRCPSLVMSRLLFLSRISTTEETFQSHIIDSTIFQTNSFDVLSEFAWLVSCTTCSVYSAMLSSESEKIFQQKLETALLIVLPDRHNAMACISSASQFDILEANKVK